MERKGYVGAGALCRPLPLLLNIWVHSGLQELLHVFFHVFSAGEGDVGEQLLPSDQCCELAHAARAGPA